MRMFVKQVLVQNGRCMHCLVDLSYVLMTKNERYIPLIWKYCRSFCVLIECWWCQRTCSPLVTYFANVVSFASPESHICQSKRGSESNFLFLHTYNCRRISSSSTDTSPCQFEMKSKISRRKFHTNNITGTDICAPRTDACKNKLVDMGVRTPSSSCLLGRAEHLNNTHT